MPRAGTLIVMLLAALNFAGPTRLPAAVNGFPYEAVVEEDEAFVRCGPGKNFYPTSKLRRGDRVIVRRHDPGGWFMIEPPPGSFSLVRADDIERQEYVGIVRQLEQGQATVRVGSALDPSIDSIFQRRLSTGERVEIVGEAVLPRKDQSVRMYKIRPPKGEFRWIEGKSLARLDAKKRDDDPIGAKNRNDNTVGGKKRDEDSIDPFSPAPAAAPEARKQPSGAPRANLAAKPATNPVSGPSPQAGPPAQSAAGSPHADPSRQSGPKGRVSNVQVVPQAKPAAAAPLDAHGRLEQVDVQFRDMVRRRPETWNLVQIEQAYRALDTQAPDPAIKNQLSMRYSAVDHYKEVKAEYDDYFRLVSETARKDAELAAIQSSLAPQNTRPPAASPLPNAELAGQTRSTGPNGPTESPGSPPPAPPSEPAATDGRGPLPTMTVPNPTGMMVETPSAGMPPAETGPPGSGARIEGGPQVGPVLGPPVPATPDGAPAATDPFVPVPTEPAADGHPREDHSRGGRSAPTNPANGGSVGEANAGPRGAGRPAPDRVGPPAPGLPPISEARPQPLNNLAPDPSVLQPGDWPPSNQPSNPPSNAQPLGPAYRSQPDVAGPSPRVAPPANPDTREPQLDEFGTLVPAEPHVHRSAPAVERRVDSLGPSTGTQPGAPLPTNPTAPPMRRPAASPGSSRGPASTHSMGPLPSMASPRQIRPQGSPPLDGAGIVQRAVTPVPGGPRHVLLALNGRILAYLQVAPGSQIQLDGFLGRPMGIMGHRSFRPELQTDLIVVSAMTPVRLVP